jgi:malate dehydrogenase (oxaloacetate-decarboxylating)(NADP+)
VTDGSKVLSLGDMGINGIAVCEGKTNLYVACGGFNP